MNIKILSVLAFAMISSTAMAQDPVGAHGFQLTPSDGDLHDGLSTWRAEEHEVHSFGLNGLLEYAAQPLVHYKREGDTLTRTVLIDSLVSLNLGAFYAPHERISLTIAAPLYLAVDGTGAQSGAGLGDLRLAGSVGLILPNEDKVSFGLSVVPFLDIPGLSQNQLGLVGLSGGGLVALSVTDSDRWDVSANIGVQFTPEVNFYNLPGEERIVSAVSVAYSLTEDVALRGEWTFRPSLTENEFAWTDSPMEAMLSLRGYTGDHLGWTFGGATALDRGAGAATWRVFAGLDLVIGARNTPELACDECGFAEIVVYTTTPDGEHVEVPVTITDGARTLGLENGDFVVLPPGGYLINVEIPPCDPPFVSIDGDQIILLEPILFDFDKASIRFPDSHRIMSELTQLLIDHPEITRLQVATGTDVRGSMSYNQDLSARRAESVVNFLVEHGVSASRLTHIGYGETRLLIESCNTEECHQANRYAEFLILESE